jgi:hypothetical protein
VIGRKHEVVQVRRVVVLVEQHDGRQFAYEVTRGEASWEWVGTDPRDGSIGTVKVTGMFHRKGRRVEMVPGLPTPTNELEPE